jgi:hypothetical protein
LEARSFTSLAEEGRSGASGFAKLDEVDDMAMDQYLLIPFLVG